jgi:hypothetical protein
MATIEGGQAEDKFFEALTTSSTNKISGESWHAPIVELVFSDSPFDVSQNNQSENNLIPIDIVFVNDGREIDLSKSGTHNLVIGGDGADAIFGDIDTNLQNTYSIQSEDFGNIFSTPKDELLFATNEEDKFLFDGNIGADVIEAFSPGHDTICIKSGINGITSASSVLAHVTDVGGNAVIDLGGGNTITIVGVVKADLDAGDFNVF